MKISTPLAALAFALTGFSALVFEIVWIRQTSLILGVSVYAYAAVVTAFLGGGALGNWLFGRVVERIQRPLLLNCFLQGGTAGLGLLTWVLLPNLQSLYAAVTREMMLGPAQVFLWRFLLAALILTPTAILMGGTLPALGRWLAQQPHSGLTAKLRPPICARNFRSRGGVSNRSLLVSTVLAHPVFNVYGSWCKSGGGRHFLAGSQLGKPPRRP